MADGTVRAVRTWLPLLALVAPLTSCGAGVPGEAGGGVRGSATGSTRRGGKTVDSQAALFPETRAGWRHIDRKTRARIDELARDYVRFLDRGKTPRRAVRALVELYRAAGASPLGEALAPGQRAFWIAPGGDAALLVIGGRGGAAAGVRGVVAAVDGPRIDLKQVPIYQHDSAYLETALYGKLTLESWQARPLALYLRLDRKKAGEIVIGEAPGDPVLVIPDAPIHLSGKVQARGREIDAERMDPYAGLSAAAVRAALRRRGIREADLTDAEAYLVPAGPAALVGVDRAMVAGYGQSRLGMAFLAARALAAASPDEATLAVILISKSQVAGLGSTGTGFVGRALSRALSAAAGGDIDVLASRRAHARSALLVASVGKGEPNGGVVLSPSSDDALPGALRRALDRLARAKVPVQIGKEAGRATVQLGTLDIDAVAVSLPVRGRGEPLELCSALDLHYAAAGLASWFAP